jgi:hypothetical protein
MELQCCCHNLGCRRILSACYGLFSVDQVFFKTLGRNCSRITGILNSLAHLTLFHFQLLFPSFPSVNPIKLRHEPIYLLYNVIFLIVEPIFHGHPSLEPILHFGTHATSFLLGLGVLFSPTMTLH